MPKEDIDALLSLLSEAAEALALCSSPPEVVDEIKSSLQALSLQDFVQLGKAEPGTGLHVFPLDERMALTLIEPVENATKHALSLLATLGRKALHRIGLSNELAKVRQLKQEMLPEPSLRLADYTASAWLLPAGETGGDIYDYWQLDEHRLGFFLADATGHGLGPAVSSSHCRGLMRGMSAANRTPDFTDLTRRLSRLLCQDTPADRFVTACLGMLDTRENFVSLVCAGHGGLVFVQSGQQVKEDWPAPDPPLGVHLQTAYHQHIMPLTPGGRLVIVTDGFVEATNPQGEAFGCERVRQLLARTPDSKPRACMRHLYEELLVFTQTPRQSDDLAVLIVQRD